MIDFKQALKFASEKCVIHFMEYLTKLFSSGNPQKEKKRKEKKHGFYALI